MTRYTTELIPTPAPPPAADAPDTAAARDTADTLRTAGHDALAAQVDALVDALDAARRQRGQLATDLDQARHDGRARLGAMIRADNAAREALARAEAAEATSARLRLALDYIANNSGAPQEAAPFARAALAQEEARGPVDYCIRVKSCQRCGEDHAMDFYALANPADDFKWWGPCPVTRQPVLLAFRTAELQEADHAAE